MFLQERTQFLRPRLLRFEVYDAVELHHRQAYRKRVARAATRFRSAPTTVRIRRCKYVSRCKARRCPKRATLIAEKTDAAGRHVRQIELCSQHCDVVIERERVRGLEISDRRAE